MSKVAPLVLGGLAALSAVAAVGLWHVRHRSDTDLLGEVLAPSGAVTDAYVGSRRCAACHREIFDRQSTTRMATAMTTADDRTLLMSLSLPAEFVDSANNVRYAVEVRDGRLSVEVQRGHESLRIPVAYAVGSGQRGLTLLNEIGEQAYEELRVSYYADIKNWDLTPGQERSQPRTLAEARGRPVAKHSDLACLNCHATLLVQSRGVVDVNRSQFGVGCERCHGPGREHSEAAERGTIAPTCPPSLVQAIELAKLFRNGHSPKSPQDELLASLAAVGDDRILRDLYVCGDCHGRADISMNLSEQMLPRSQVAALVSSACYRLSEEKLRCTDCHDPHGDISRNGDERPYVAVCLKCHEPAANEAPQVADRRVGPRSCPTNARQRCIGCHMPLRTPMYRATFTHHRIGVYPESYREPPDPAQPKETHDVGSEPTQ